MRKTMHLSMVEDGAYGRLLDWYYANDRPIPHERRHALARATSQAERVAVDAVLAEFFSFADGSHRNDRCDAEIASAAKRIATAKENGSRGGRKPKSNPAGNPLGYPVGSDPLTQEPSSLSPSPYSLRSEEKPGANAPSSTAVPPTDAAIDPGDADADADGCSDVEMPKGCPPCPHQKILALFAERCPALSQPRSEVWSGQRARNLSARWRWLLTAKRKGERAGERFATNTEQGLEWFGKYFDVVAESGHLTGDNGRGWRATLEWLVKDDNFAKVFSGNYSGGGQ